jgi:hypothetical protein
MFRALAKAASSFFRIAVTVSQSFRKADSRVQFERPNTVTNLIGSSRTFLRKMPPIESAASSECGEMMIVPLHCDVDVFSSIRFFSRIIGVQFQYPILEEPSLLKADLCAGAG